MKKPPAGPDDGDGAPGSGHRRAALLCAAVLAVFLGPTLLRGRVLYPTDNAVELGAQVALETRVRYFSDVRWLYVPEIHHHLNGDRSGWLSLWNPHVELGRPSAHLFGQSKAYWLTHLLSLLTADPFVLYTALVAGALALSAAFGYLLLRELGLSPAACAAGALGLSLSIFPGFNHTSILFLWAIAWGLALLWAIQRASHGLRASHVLAIAFFVHGHLLGAYPQHTVWHAYAAMVWTALALARAPGSARAKLARAAGIGGGVALGALSAAPVFLDIALAARESARTGAELSFFLPGLEAFSGFGELLVVLAKQFDALWFGNPARDDYPLPFTGLSWTPPVAMLLAAAFAPALLRRWWPVHALFALGAVMAFSPAVYELGWRHALLDLSRLHPLMGVFVLGLVLAALAADRAIRDRTTRRLALPLAAVPLACAWTGAALRPELVHLPFLLAGSALGLGTLAFLWSARPWILLAVAAASALHYSHRLQLVREPDSIERTSSLVAEVQAGGEGGARFLWVGKEKARFVPLPPSFESLVELRSVHTYNSLSSRRYQEWVGRLGRGETFHYGRFFTSLESLEGIDRAELSRAGVGLILSYLPVDPSGRRSRRARTVVERTVLPPVLEAQVGAFRSTGRGEVEIGASLEDAGSFPLERTLEEDDRIRFRTTPAEEPTLLFVSQQFHPHWEASADGVALETVVVDGFYQGVLLPPRTRSVELRFLPNVRWSFLPQLAFALAGGALAVRRLVRRRGRGVEPTPSGS